MKYSLIRDRFANSSAEIFDGPSGLSFLQEMIHSIQAQFPPFPILPDIQVTLFIVIIDLLFQIYHGRVFRVQMDRVSMRQDVVLRVRRYLSSGYEDRTSVNTIIKKRFLFHHRFVLGAYNFF